MSNLETRPDVKLAPVTPKRKADHTSSYAVGFLAGPLSSEPEKALRSLEGESVGALAESVKSFDGAVIVVSHDQYFVGEVANEAWVVNDGAVTQIESFLAYRKNQLAKLNKMK